MINISDERMSDKIDINKISPMIRYRLHEQYYSMCYYGIMINNITDTDKWYILKEYY